MSFLTLHLNQNATWWSKTGVDSFGQPSFAAPVPLKVRWEGRIEMVLNDDGFEVPSRARIFLDRELNVGDYLYLGTSVVADPKTLLGAWPILAFRRTPDLSGLIFENKAYL